MNPSRIEPQRHRGTEKRKTEKKISKETRKAGKEKADPSSLLVSWLP
jgi:hypothetical protein